ncbi:MAG: hypothetical protein ACYDBW_06220 [Sulfuricaulis sp.]
MLTISLKTELGPCRFSGKGAARPVSEKSLPMGVFFKLSVASLVFNQIKQGIGLMAWNPASRSELPATAETPGRHDAAHRTYCRRMRATSACAGCLEVKPVNRGEK